MISGLASMISSPRELGFGTQQVHWQRPILAGTQELESQMEELLKTVQHLIMEACTVQFYYPPTIFSKKKYINIFSHADGLWRSLPCSNTYAVMCEKVVETSPKGINFDMFGARKNVVNSCFWQAMYLAFEVLKAQIFFYSIILKLDSIDNALKIQTWLFNKLHFSRY